MARVEVSTELAAYITSQIAKLADDPTDEWLAGRVRLINALPLMLDSQGTYAIRADGELVQFEWGRSTQPSPVHHPRIINTILYQGSCLYPVLASLVPERPATAATCPHCGGTGRASWSNRGEEPKPCFCGGVGWLPQPA